MLKYARLTCAWALSSAALFAQTVPVPSSVETTGMVGIADAQTAQLNLLNPGFALPAIGGSCSATVAFVDSNGTVLKSTTLTVTPGKSMPFDLHSDSDLQIVSGGRREIRATISTPIVATPVATTTAAITACKLIPTLELLDTVSGRTLVVLGHAAQVPAAPTATP